MQNKFRRYHIPPKKADDVAVAERVLKPLQLPPSTFTAANSTQVATQRAPQKISAPVVTGRYRPYQVIQKPTNSNPQSAAYILENYSYTLSDYERREITSYETIYYHGQKASKQYDPQQPNDGYDEKDGDYNPVVSDHVAYRYELLKLLGQGSFGKVYRALDHKHKRVVALKMLKNKKKFRKQGLVEIQLLEKLRTSDPDNQNHCITLLNRGEFRNHLFMVFDLLSMDLYAYLAKNELKGCPIGQVRDFASQCVKALAFSASLSIIHADIKPENILLETEGSNKIQVIDWGSGALVGHTLYQYIQSRFYRAPEVILGMPYSYEIDTWSMGCVFFELFTGYPVFQGTDEFDQIGKIVEVLGFPPEHILARAPRAGEFFWDIVEGGVRVPKLRSSHKPMSRTLAEMLAGAGEDFVEMVEAMLRWDPRDRVTMEQLKGFKFFQTIQWNAIELSEIRAAQKTLK